jgi:hypothetical protein
MNIYTSTFVHFQLVVDTTYEPTKLVRKDIVVDYSSFY